MYEKSIIITLVGGRTNEIPIDWRILCGRNYGNSIFLVNEVCRRDGSEYGYCFINKGRGMRFLQYLHHANNNKGCCSRSMILKRILCIFHFIEIFRSLRFMLEKGFC